MEKFERNYISNWLIRDDLNDLSGTIILKRGTHECFHKIIVLEINLVFQKCNVIIT